MNHSYHIFTDPKDWEPFRAQYEASGGQWPEQGVMFAEFDEQGLPVACQFLQVGVFAEGMWARDGSAHLRRLFNMLVDFLKEQNKGKEVSLLTMAKSDEKGQQIGRCAKRLGFEETGWNVYRRVLKCQ